MSTSYSSGSLFPGTRNQILGNGKVRFLHSFSLWVNVRFLFIQSSSSLGLFFENGFVAIWIQSFMQQLQIMLAWNRQNG
jgi:hypothetical protein